MVDVDDDVRASTSSDIRVHESIVAPVRAPGIVEEAPRRVPTETALLSAFIPGAGQVMQGRYVAALVQGATVLGYVIAAFAAGGGRAFWLALAWNVWSAVDAYLHERTG